MGTVPQEIALCAMFLGNGYLSFAFLLRLRTLSLAHIHLYSYASQRSLPLGILSCPPLHGPTTQSVALLHSHCSHHIGMVWETLCLLYL